MPVSCTQPPVSYGRGSTAIRLSQGPTPEQKTKKLKNQNPFYTGNSDFTPASRV
jgi:hypothetical protein